MQPLQINAHPPRLGRVSHWPEYRAWEGMKARCFNANNHAFAAYGDRGITVHSDWAESFEAFFMAVGPRPNASDTLERIDNSLGYQPGNVKWASRKEQANNTRRNRKITFNGETLTISDWARRVGITLAGLLVRLKSGWPIESALTVKTVRRRTKTHIVVIEYNGTRLTLAECSEATGFSAKTLHARLSRGWTATEIMTRKRSLRCS